MDGLTTTGKLPQLLKLGQQMTPFDKEFNAKTRENTDRFFRPLRPPFFFREREKKKLSPPPALKPPVPDL